MRNNMFLQGLAGAWKKHKKDRRVALGVALPQRDLRMDDDTPPEGEIPSVLSKSS